MPPLVWIEAELRYWLPALVRCRRVLEGRFVLNLHFGLMSLAIAAMYYNLLNDPC